MLPVLQVAKDGEISMSDARDKIAVMFDLTDEDIGKMLPSGRQTLFSNRVAWARTFISKALLVETTRRGHFQITERGQSVLDSNPDQINVSFLNQFSEFLEWREASAQGKKESDGQDDNNGTASTPEEKIEANYQSLLSAVHADVMERLQDCSWQFFERLIIDLLVAMGYGGGRAEMGEAFTKSGDGGIDGVIKEDALGLDAVYIQAKKWNPNNSFKAGRPDLQKFVGSLDGYGATKGLFVCLSGFSEEARDYIRTASKRVILVDGKELANLMIRHNVGVRVRDVYQLKGLDEDYFSE